MADAPKKFDKAEAPTPLKHTFETFMADTLVLIFGLFILGALLGRIALVFGGSSAKFSIFGTFAAWFLDSAYPIIKIISIILSALFLWGIIHAVRNLSKINREYNEKRKKTISESLAPITGKVPNKKLNVSKEWHTVLTHASSHNTNDWKIAILDADSILDDVLKAKGYIGDTMADRLKAIDRGDLRNLDLAWEAHKYRNAIAHGDSLEFNQHEVRRIISNFERVFKEFGVI